MENKINLSSGYIERFFVGLLDGAGMIIVNLDKRSNTKSYFLRYRFAIALPNIEANVEMLQVIKQRFGGMVKIRRLANCVSWSVSSYARIVDIMRLLDRYPLLTSSMICQLNFLRKCIEAGENGSLYFEKFKDIKYADQPSIIAYQSKLPLLNLDYFAAWLSGFIEADGYFTYRKNSRGKKHTYCFYVGKQYDLYLVESMKNYFASTNKVVLCPRNYYAIDMCGSQVRNNLISHFQKYPLLGAGHDSFSRWLVEFPT